MGFNLNKAREKKEEIIKSFTPLDLNEGEVQAIFNRCLATESCKDITVSSLYFSSLGYEKEDDGLLFDKKQILLNRQNIEYLYGQLKPIHIKQHMLKLDDFLQTYAGITWVRDNASLMQLLYLGSSDELTILNHFIAKYNGTTLNMNIKPTLSPKDPNFPAWWEEHKSEWEEPKKEGKEPSDD